MVLWAGLSPLLSTVLGVNRASSRGSGRVGAVLLATLFTVLFGFFAMHGVAAHGVSHPDGSHSAIPGVAHASNHHADHQAGTEAPKHSAAYRGLGAAGPPEPGPGSPDNHGDAGEACLAILGLLLIALVALVARRGQSVRPLLVLRQVKTRLIVCARPGEPPCLHSLSILRC